MAARGFGIQTLTGSAQPVFGTTLSAAINPTPDAYTGNFRPGSNPSYGTVTVTNASIFRQGDRVQVGTLASFGFQGSPTPDGAKILAINYGTKTLTLQGLTRAHGSGEFIVLDMTPLVLIVQPVSLTADTGVLYLGEDSSVAQNSATLFYQITAAQATAGKEYYLGKSGTVAAWDTPHLWTIGTANDTFLPMIIL